MRKKCLFKINKFPFATSLSLCFCTLPSTWSFVLYMRFCNDPPGYFHCFPMYSVFRDFLLWPQVIYDLLRLIFWSSGRSFGCSACFPILELLNFEWLNLVKISSKQPQNVILMISLAPNHWLGLERALVWASRLLGSFQAILWILA